MQESIITRRIRLESKGNCHLIDITQRIASLLAKEALSEGHVLLFVPGSTAGLTTIEYEPGLLQDLPEAFDRLVPTTIPYAHDATWHDGNGHSHVRAALLGPSLIVPFSSGKLLLGTWQQIVLVDFDNRPRSRELVVQLSGYRERSTEE